MLRLCFCLLGCVLAASGVWADATREIVPDQCYQLDIAWREVKVPRTAYLYPFLTFKDAQGRVMSRSGGIGQIQQRAFLPDAPEVQSWRIFAVPEATTKQTIGAAGFEGAAIVKIPAATRSLTLSVARRGSPAEIADLTCTIEPCAPPAHLRCQFPPLPKVPELSDAALDAALAANTRLRTKTVRHGDRTEVLIDGQVTPLKIYKNCPWDEPQRYRAAKVFAEKGFNAFTLDLSLAKIWNADGSVRLAEFRTILRKMLRCNPQAMIFLELKIRPRPNWGMEHPDEIFRCESGKYGIFTHGRVIAYRETPADDPTRKAFAHPSYLSATFFDEAAAVIRQAFAEMETWPESKRIIGVYVNAGTDGQWLDLYNNSVLARAEAADYSVASQRGFDAWRRAHGRTPVAIPSTSAFGTTTRVDFGEHTLSPESDWREFYATKTAEHKLKLAHAIKTATGGRLLVGSYSPQTGLAGYPLIAQTAAWQLIQSPDWDFFAVVPSYVREPWDPVVSAVYDATTVRHAKLFVSELDLRSGDVGNWGFYGLKHWRQTHTASTYREKVMHYVAHALTRGGTYHAYDMDGGWFNTPAAQETWEIANRIAEAAKPMKWTDEAVAMVFGERFFDHRSQNYGHMLAYALREMPRHALATAGVPYRLYVADDLLADPQAKLPKVMLFTDPSTLTAAQYREFKARYAREGRILVWFGRPGLYAVDGQQIDAEFGFQERPTANSRWIEANGESSDPLMKGVQGLFTAWYPYYYDGIIFPKAVVPTGWTPLANFQGTEVPAVSVRRSTDYTEVFIANPGLIPQQFIRNLARAGGFQPLLETDDISGYGSGIFYILSCQDGVKHFRLPQGVQPAQVLYGPEIRPEGDGYAVELKRGKMFVLKVNTIK